MDPMLIADWSELPHDVLEHLASFLQLRDYHRFGAVCRNWCSVTKEKRHPPAQQLPWLVLGDDNATQKRILFDLSEERQFYIDIPELRGQRLCGSSYGWLFTLDIELNFCLLNPFTKKCYNLPPLPPYSRHWDITTYKKVPQPDDDDITFEDMQNMLVHKAILDRDPSHSSDFKVLMLYGEHKVAACWSPGNSAWTLIESHHPTLHDVIFYKHNFYAVGPDGWYSQIYLVDTGPDPKITRVGPRVPESDDNFKYLVDFMGELLLVERYTKIREDYWFTVKIIIYKIDLENEKYSRCKQIDDLAIFIGTSSPVIVDPSKFPGFKKNALYFTDLTSCDEKTGCNDLCLYDLDRDASSRYYPREIFVPLAAAPTWLYPNPW